jgi:hypothetical protein
MTATQTEGGTATLIIARKKIVARPIKKQESLILHEDNVEQNFFSIFVSQVLSRKKKADSLCADCYASLCIRQS